MTLRTLKSIYEQGLKNQYTKSEIDVIFFALAEQYLEKGKTILRLALDEEWDSIEKKYFLFKNALQSLQQGVPFQYVTGEASFLGKTFFVNKHVLIPRPETEELVEWVLEKEKKYPGVESRTILDLGTGSGVIAIALKKALPRSEVWAVDISEPALHVAQTNAKLHATEINFLKANLLENNLTLPKADIIVSNPPYIPLAEKEKMPRSVTQYEPAQALFVPTENPLIFYEKIAKLAKENLKPNGYVYLEIHQDLMERTQSVLKKYFAEVKGKKDLSQNWRMLRCHRMK